MNESKSKSKNKSKKISFKYFIGCHLFKYLILLLCLIPDHHFFNSRYSFITIFSNDNEIRLKVKGDGTYKIIDSISNISSIYVNGGTTAISTSVNLPDSMNNVSLVFNSSLSNCYYLFRECNKITEIDLTDFISSNVGNINYMFYGCTSLTSIKFGNFKTSKLYSMENVFKNCESLEELDLSSFDTSNVIDFHYMFSGCKSLKSLDLTNFRTSSCKCIRNMFENCISLTSVDLSSFGTSKVIYMDYMFYNCKNLISLDLSSFDTSSCNDIDNMFYGCEKLEFVNFKNALLSTNLMYYYNMINNTAKNIVFVVDETKTSVLNNLLEGNNCAVKISEISITDWRRYQKKIVPNSDTCVESCTSPYPYEYLGKCYNECPGATVNIDNICYCNSECKECQDVAPYCKSCKDSNKFLNNVTCVSSCSYGYYTDNSNKICCPLEKCSQCTKESLAQNLCIKCNNEKGYYAIYDEQINNSGNIHCYNDNIEGYYLDTDEKFYKPCYNSCKSCEKNGNDINHNCITCANSYYQIYNDPLNKNQYINCYNNPKGYYLDNDDNLYKKCYQSCELCDKKGTNSNNNCLKCDKEYFYELNVLDRINCYKECEFYSYYDSDNDKYYCTPDSNCPKNIAEFLIPNKKICIDDCSKDKDFPFQNNGECVSSCSYGYYTENSNNICCPLEKCSQCTKESLAQNLCIKCNNEKGYYAIYNEQINNSGNIHCYDNNIEGYYLDTDEKFYKPCYNSCKSCEKNGDDINHNCITCNSNYDFSINKNSYYNCYHKCDNYYYFNNEGKYICLENKICPEAFNKLIIAKGQCIDDCSKDIKYSYEFRNKCYEECPKITSYKSKDKNNFCEVNCTKETPLEIVEYQNCTNYCGINDMHDKKCISKYEDEETNQNLILYNILQDITTSNFIKDDLYNNNEDIIIEEIYTTFTITTNKILKKNNNQKVNLGKCENILRNFYDLKSSDNLVIFIIEINKDNQYAISKIVYEVYAELNNNNELKKLDLNICNDTLINNEITKCEKYSIESILEDSCISCANSYYQIYNDPLNKNQFINCYNNPKGYYLDNDDNLYKKCYQSCELCDKKGTKNNNNCLKCYKEYFYELNVLDRINCYKECEFYSYYDSDNDKYYCTPDSNCPKNIAEFLIPNKKICIDDCSKDKDFPFQNNGECVSSCPYGYYTDNSNNICCPLEKCSQCTKESLAQNLCIKCNNEKGYYAIYNEQINNSGNIHCYDNNIEGYYLDTDEKFYKPCYNSCKSCEKNGDDINHNCITCANSYYQIYNDPLNKNQYINCYNNPKGYYLDDDDNLYKKCYQSCELCDKKGTNSNNNCLKCYKEYFYELNVLDRINCYKECEFYSYYDSDNDKYYCTPDSNCPKNIAEFLIPNKKVCIDDCSKDKDNPFQFRHTCYNECPKNISEKSLIKEFYCEARCPKDFPFEMIETQYCVNNCSISERQKGLCKINNEPKENEPDKEAEEKAVENVKEELTSSNFNTSEVDKGESIVIKQKDSTITISSSENQKKEKSKNTTNIDLGECEDKIKEEYHIPKDKTLYILKIDINQEGLQIPKIEYEVYYPLFGGSLVKLNLTVCSDSKIDLSIPVVLTENIEKMNSSSDYYNDICYTTTSVNGTDISLSDRKKEFVNNNLTVCEEDCDFSDYDYDLGKAVCSCKVKTNSTAKIIGVTIDKDKLYNSFTDFKNIANVKVLKCYKLIFGIDAYKYNYANLILIFVIFLYFITLFYFYCKDYPYLLRIINFVIFFKTNNLLSKKFEKRKQLEEEEKKKSESPHKSTITTKKRKQNKNINANKSKKQKQQRKKRVLPTPLFLQYLNYMKQSYSNPIKKKKKSKRTIFNYKRKNINITDGKNEKNKTNNKGIINTNANRNNKRNEVNRIQTMNESNKKITIEENGIKIELGEEELYEMFLKINKYTDLELNKLPYDKAINLDKRNFCKYYASLVRTKHLLVFSFMPVFDYNSRILKIFLFFFNFTVNFVVNALFFNDGTMHKIYIDGGSFNFIYNIPQILYSALICGLFNGIINLLALSDSSFVLLKNKSNKNNVKSKAKEMISILKIKFVFFFVINLVLLVWFWFYLGCFCAVYKNTQIHLIKDTLISFATSMLYPFALYFIPGIFRISALKGKNKTIMYNFSKLIELL